MKLNVENLIQNPHQHLIGEITKFSEQLKIINNPLIKKLKKINYDLMLDFTFKNLTLKIQGTIIFEVEAVDANDGQTFVYGQELSWNDQYRFDEKFQSNANFIINSEFDLLSYLVEQINLNIPLNLSKNHDIISKVGSGWELLSETDYQVKKQQSNDSDLRWEKLDQWKNK